LQRQVTDANNTVAYGDSLPIVLGHGGENNGLRQGDPVIRDTRHFALYQTNWTP
jgi:hypothetical protein